MRTVKQQMKEGQVALVDIEREQLAYIADAMIEQIMSRMRRLTPAQYLTAIKDVKTPGVNSYKAILQTALAVITFEAIEAARKEVPKAKGVKLSEVKDDTIQLAEWDKLPAKIRKQIATEINLIVGTQIADLEKNLFFQFTSSVNSTDSLAVIEDDLREVAEDFIKGPGIAAGSAVTSAKYVNVARQAFFYDEEVLQQIEAFEFVNADPVSPICQDLAGTIFGKDDPNADRYQPPLHWNCKSWIRPILTGNLPSTKEIEKLKPSTAKLEQSIQFAEGVEHRCPHCG